MEIHGEIGHGSGTRGNPGPRVEVLNRSAIVLTTAIWEGYCEEVAAEALRHLIDHSADPKRLPKRLRAQVSAELNPEQAWQLAGDGWKKYLAARLATYAEKRAREFNTPASKRVDELMLEAIGLDKITDAWKWPPTTASKSRNKLDGWVQLRQDIAHGSGAAKPVRKKTVESYRTHVGRLVERTDAAVDAYLLQETGQSFF